MSKNPSDEAMHSAVKGNVHPRNDDVCAQARPNSGTGAGTGARRIRRSVIRSGPSGTLTGTYSIDSMLVLTRTGARHDDAGSQGFCMGCLAMPI